MVLRTLLPRHLPHYSPGRFITVLAALLAWYDLPVAQTDACVLSAFGLLQVLLATDLAPCEFHTDQMPHVPSGPHCRRPHYGMQCYKHRVCKCACWWGAGDRQLVVLDYSAAWCGPCRMMEPVLAGWARELAPRVVFIKADAEAAGNRQLAGSAGIRCAS